MYLYNNVSSSLFHNRVYIQSDCNDRRNTFNSACCQWYSYNNPQFLKRYTHMNSNKNNSIFICIHV